MAGEDARDPDQGERSRVPAARARSGRRVRAALVADDSAAVRRLLEHVLKQLGFAPQSAEDGRQAVEAWRSGAFDVILMDIQMPVMDGLSATREIRRGERGGGRAPTPVIVISADPTPERMCAGLEAGAQRFLAKPVDPGALALALEELLGPARGRTPAGAPRIKSGDGVGLDPGKPEADHWPA